jgi:adenylate kinase
MWRDSGSGGLPSSTAGAGCWMRVLGDRGHCGAFLYYIECRGMASAKADRAAWIEGPTGACDPVPLQQTAYRLVLLGPPGVGKGTQADMLNQRLRACHLSTGDVFRAAGRNGECVPSPAMATALAHMRRGELVPDATVWDVVRERKGCLRCGGGFILDGFPRTLMQAESLQQLVREEGITLTAVVNYELPLSAIIARLSGRRTCQNCKSVFHVMELPPIVPGECDRCKGKLFTREDDRPESIRIRMAAYERSTAPLIEFYSSLDLLMSVAATGTPEQICERTVQGLEGRRT